MAYSPIPGAKLELFSVYGLRVYVSPDIPKMRLYDEVIPGVPWPPGFKEDIDAWMASFFSKTNLLKDGEVLKTGNDIHMNPRTYAALRDATKEN